MHWDLLWHKILQHLSFNRRKHTFFKMTVYMQSYYLPMRLDRTTSSSFQKIKTESQRYFKQSSQDKLDFLPLCKLRITVQILQQAVQGAFCVWQDQTPSHNSLSHITAASWIPIVLPLQLKLISCTNLNWTWALKIVDGYFWDIPFWKIYF